MTATATGTRPLSTSNDALLRFAMRLDATLSGLIGLGIAVSSEHVAELTGLDPSQEFATGAAFVLYGVVVYGLASLRNLRPAGLGVVAANAAGTIAAVVVVAGTFLPLTQLGLISTVATGLYTAGFAVLQYLGVRRLT